MTETLVELASRWWVTLWALPRVLGRDEIYGKIGGFRYLMTNDM